jgi:hypothetical protein
MKRKIFRKKTDFELRLCVVENLESTLIGNLHHVTRLHQANLESDFQQKHESTK